MSATAGRGRLPNPGWRSWNDTASTRDRAVHTPLTRRSPDGDADTHQDDNAGGAKAGIAPRKPLRRRRTDNQRNDRRLRRAARGTSTGRGHHPCKCSGRGAQHENRTRRKPATAWST